MVGEPDTPEVLELEFDEVNTQHLADHGVTPFEVLEVLNKAPKFFRNLEGRASTHVMLGSANDGRFYYVPIRPAGKPRLCRPITAYRYSRRRALRYYKEIP